MTGVDGADRVHGLVEELAGCPPDALTLSDVQALTAVVARAYGAAIERGPIGGPVAPEAITATDAVVLCRGVMAAADIELFELSMWGAIQMADPADSDSGGSDEHGRQ